MGFELKKGTNFTLAPAGTHPARCYMVIDIGIQPVEFQGQKKDPRPKVRLGFELPFEKHVFKEEKGPEPFTLSRSFTNSLSDKGSLKPVLNAWRGKELTAEDIAGFSFAKLIGKPALITVVHENKKDGGRVAKISAIAKLPAVMAGQKIELPPAILPVVLYSIDDGPNHPEFKKLPTWIQEECARCEQWTQPPEDDGQPVGTPAGGAIPPDAAGTDDDTPF